MNLTELKFELTRLKVQLLFAKGNWGHKGRPGSVGGSGGGGGVIDDRPLFGSLNLLPKEKKAIYGWQTNSDLIKEAIATGSSGDYYHDDYAIDFENMMKEYKPDGDLSKQISRGLAFNPDNEGKQKKFEGFLQYKPGEVVTLDRTYSGYSYNDKIVDKHSNWERPEYNSVKIVVIKRTSPGHNIYDKGSKRFINEKEVVLPNVKMKILERSVTEVGNTKKLLLKVEEVE